MDNNETNRSIYNFLCTPASATFRTSFNEFVRHELVQFRTIDYYIIYRKFCIKLFYTHFCDDTNILHDLTNTNQRRLFKIFSHHILHEFF